MKALDHQWRTSSRSGGNGACVEARYADATAQVRDSKDRQGPVLSFTADQWTGFVQGIKSGTFNA
ncbi:protein of unknown function [Micromonospora pallida]|uniref:DUF397 domain-containing protein n=1 Tax=Micromonospora pallida TaxID=145854 RepID=A0A1C6T7Q6_9ACTN|nr:DUF397 domain-containing protein [Micromonospora pallida]SCL37553.1 protein of unknown function [Micromonospora pallida]